MSNPLDEAMSELRMRARQMLVTLDDEQTKLLRLYCQQLAEYNTHTNLVSDADAKTVVIDHILDSLSLVSFIEGFKRRKSLEPKRMNLVDIGSGAGLPGLVLAVALPYLDVTLVDSVGKKIRFLESFIEAADLSSRVRAISERAEVLAHQDGYRGAFHAATARAVGGFELVAELGIPFLKVGGQLYVQKSLSQLDEASRMATRSLPKLGGTMLEATALDARVLGKQRAIIVAEKVSATSSQYPRSWAQIKHRPLSQ